MIRSCQWCSVELPWRARLDARFCGTRCRVASHRAGAFPAAVAADARWTRAAGKRPITTTGRPASSTDPATWTTYHAARRSSAGDGYGVMLGSGLGCYDLDHVDDDQARAFIATIAEPVVYAERSVSGRGVHVFTVAEPTPGWRRIIGGISVERYTRARFIRTTGRTFAL